MIDILVDEDGNTSDDDEEGLPEEEAEEAAEQAPALKNQAPNKRSPLNLIPLPSTTEPDEEVVYKQLFTERVHFAPAGLYALQDMVDLPYPNSSLLAEGLDEAILTLAEGFFGQDPYHGVRTFVEEEDEIREIMAMDFLNVFEEQGHDTNEPFTENHVRELVPLLLLLTGRAMQEEPLPRATQQIMEEFWKDLDLRPDASTADLDRIATWYYQTRIPARPLLRGLRKVLDHYMNRVVLPR